LADSVEEPARLTLPSVPSNFTAQLVSTDEATRQESRAAFVFMALEQAGIDHGPRPESKHCFTGESADGRESKDGLSGAQSVFSQCGGRGMLVDWLRMFAAMIAPFSVKAYGKYLL
jgi:hypothetical protein